VIDFPKANKPADRSDELFRCYVCRTKCFERHLLVRLELIVDPHLSDHQACFRRVRSTVQQVVKLTAEIKARFKETRKAGLMLVDLKAAYIAL